MNQGKLEVVKQEMARGNVDILGISETEMEIARVPDELWMEARDIVQETGIKTIPMEKKCKKAKWLSGDALQIAVKEEKQKAKEKRKDINI